MSEGAGGQRRRFEALDAIRGVCAILVMVFHSCTFLTGRQPVASAYLAVDIFFIMSGFVIAHAYEAKLQRGGYLGAFLWRRYARLAPMWVIGLALGTVVYMLLHHGEPGALKAPLIAIPALAFVPDLTSGGRLFPYDLPGWSLFDEVLANIAYGLVLQRCTTRILAVIAAIAAVVVAALIAWRGDINAGADWAGLPLGLARIGFDFPVGLLFYRLRHRFAAGSWHPAVLLAMLAALVAVSRLDPQGTGRQLFDTVGLLLACPAVIWCGLNVRAAGARVSQALGLVSYPLYVIHFPAMMGWSFVWYHLGRAHAWPMPLAAAAAFMLCLLPVAWALGRYADPFLQRLLVRQATRVGGFAYGSRALPGDN